MHPVWLIRVSMKKKANDQNEMSLAGSVEELAIISSLYKDDSTKASEHTVEVFHGKAQIFAIRNIVKYCWAKYMLRSLVTSKSKDFLRPIDFSSTNGYYITWKVGSCWSRQQPCAICSQWRVQRDGEQYQKRVHYRIQINTMLKFRSRLYYSFFCLRSSCYHPRAWLLGNICDNLQIYKDI